MRKRSIGLVIPVFNEARRLDLAYLTEIAKIPELFLLFVDDGSTDSSSKILISNFEKFTNVEVLKLDLNSGKSEAVRQGWHFLNRNGHHEIVGFLDCDGAFALKDIERCIAKARKILRSQDSVNITSQSLGFEALWTSRLNIAGRSIERSRERHLAGRIFTKIIGLVFKKLPWDTQSGLKFFINDRNFQSTIEDRFITRWLFEIEIILRFENSNRRRYLIWEEVLDHWKDVGGSKIKVSDVFLIFIEFLSLVKQHKKKGKVLWIK